MGATDFLTASKASIEALRTASLLKSLSVNALVVGEIATGKSILMRYILPDAPMLDASDFENVLNVLESNDEVVLMHLEHCPNLTLLFEKVIANKVRLIASWSLDFIPDDIRDFFSVRIMLPPLKERPEDVVMLQEHFAKEAAGMFGVPYEQGMISDLKPDLSRNAFSLRRQVYFKMLLGSVSEFDVLGVMESYLTDEMGSNNDYRRFLHLYEVPLIRCGLRKYKSQLQLSEYLGLNRNTLRKKISEHSSYLKGEK